MNILTPKSPRTTLFDFQGHSIRTSVDARSSLWFVATDICSALDIKNSRDALRNLDDDEKGVANTDTLGGMQTVTIVNESGLYELIFRSRKPEAKEFKRWVKQTVLPAVRKDGMYISGEENLFNGCTTDEQIHARMAELSTQVEQVGKVKLAQLAAERSRLNREEKEARQDALRFLNRGRSRRSTPRHRTYKPTSPG